MSEDTKHTSTEVSEDVPAPRHFVLSPVLDGSYHKGLPTITAVYLNSDKWPDAHFMMGIVAASLDRHETDPSRLILHLFIPPDEFGGGEMEETTIATETCGFELSANEKTIEDFWVSAKKVKSFTLSVSTEEYYFYCRVDMESTGVTDVRCDWRYLN